MYPFAYGIKNLKNSEQRRYCCVPTGAGRGYSLERRADDIRVAEIIEAFEGPIALTACVDSAVDNCSIEALCPMKGNWNTVNEAIRTTLFSLTLADMITVTPLEKMKNA